MYKGTLMKYEFTCVKGTLVLYKKDLKDYNNSNRDSFVSSYIISYNIEQIFNMVKDNTMIELKESR
jgi:hypothetical protein